MAEQLLEMNQQQEETKEKKVKKEKTSKVKITKIQATSRMSVKIRDNFYTVEYLEERSLPNITNEEELNLEKSRLFNSVNSTIDAQIAEIVEGFQK